MRMSQKEQSAADTIAALEADAARMRAAEKRKTTPVRSQAGALEAAEQQVGQDHPREMPSTGPARLEPTHVEPVDRPVSDEKLEMLRFMEDVLTIQVHDSVNPTDEPIPYVINGGQRQAFIRGQEQCVRRKYVEVLARMKKTIYTQERYKDSQGIDQIRQIPHTSLVYPFSVVHDPNPRGKDWLKAILAEA